MTVAVNPVRKEAAGNNIEILKAAIGVATDLYKVKMNNDALEAANKIKQEQIAADTIKETRLAEERANKTKTDNLRDFVPVSEGTKGAFNLPGQDGYYLSRADVRAQEQNKTALAGKEIERNQKASDTDFNRTQKLSDDYNKESKESLGAINGYKKVEAAALNPNPTGQTDLALIYGLMKTLDPNSSVKEGETAMAEQSQGAAKQYTNAYNSVLRGERLTPETRQSFLAEAKRALQAQLGVQKNLDELYTSRANQFKVDPAFVVNPMFGKLRNELGDLDLSGGVGNKVVDIPGVGKTTQADIQAELRKRMQGTASK